MATNETAVVTGAFGFTSYYIAERLLANGQRVRTLTGHPDYSTPISDEIHIEPYHFDDPKALTENLSGADTLFNTYWIRFPDRGTTFTDAVDNIRTLVHAAQKAGIRRIVHFSVANVDASALPYFRGKARAEEVVKSSELTHAILRPTLIFGRGDVLINNLAWFLRRLPVFPVIGDGDYEVQPVHVGDVAELAVELGKQNTDQTLDVAGADTYTFEEFMRCLARGLDVSCRFVHTPPRVAYVGTTIVGQIMGDVILTRNEMRALMDNLLVTESSPRGGIRFDEWIGENGHVLGNQYNSFRRG